MPRSRPLALFSTIALAGGLAIAGPVASYAVETEVAALAGADFDQLVATPDAQTLIGARSVPAGDCGPEPSVRVTIVSTDRTLDDGADLSGAPGLCIPNEFVQFVVPAADSATAFIATQDFGEVPVLNTVDLATLTVTDTRPGLSFPSGAELTSTGDEIVVASGAQSQIARYATDSIEDAEVIDTELAPDRIALIPNTRDAVVIDTTVEQWGIISIDTGALRRTGEFPVDFFASLGPLIVDSKGLNAYFYDDLTQEVRTINLADGFVADPLLEFVETSDYLLSADDSAFYYVTSDLVETPQGFESTQVLVAVPLNGGPRSTFPLNIGQPGVVVAQPDGTALWLTDVSFGSSPLVRIPLAAFQPVNGANLEVTRGEVLAPTPVIAGAVAGTTTTVAEGSLPEGLTLDASTGVLSGTPAVEGISELQLVLTGTPDGIDRTATFTLTVQAAAEPVDPDPQPEPEPDPEPTPPGSSDEGQSESGAGGAPADQASPSGSSDVLPATGSAPTAPVLALGALLLGTGSLLVAMIGRRVPHRVSRGV